MRILKSCDVSEEKDKKVIKGLIEEYTKSSDNRPLTKKFNDVMKFIGLNYCLVREGKEYRIVDGNS